MFILASSLVVRSAMMSASSASLPWHFFSWEFVTELFFHVTYTLIPVLSCEISPFYYTFLSLNVTWQDFNCIDWSRVSLAHYKAFSSTNLSTGTHSDLHKYMKQKLTVNSCTPKDVWINSCLTFTTWGKLDLVGLSSANFVQSLLSHFLEACESIRFILDKRGLDKYEISWKFDFWIAFSFSYMGQLPSDSSV